MSETLQLIIVALILAAVVAVIIYRLVRHRRRPGCQCPGCSLSDVCTRKPD